MRTVILLLFFSMLSCISASGQCNSGFTTGTNLSWVMVTANNNTAGLWHTWNFGDGTPLSGGATATHEYNQSGTYVITHIVRDTMSNCWDSTKQTVTVSFSYSCTANFSYTLDTSTGRYTFTSTSSTSAPPSGTSEYYWWKVDGSYRGTGPTLNIALSPGQHNVCLEMSRLGCGDSVCKTITVPQAPACTTQASISYSAEPGNPNRIRFSASPNLPNARYDWNIGGHYYFTREVTHVFSGAGTYPVWLSVADSVGLCSDSVLQYVTVQRGPADSCVVSLTHQHNPSQNNSVTFSVNSNQPIQFMQGHIENLNGWGDSLYLNQPYALPDTGTYIVELTVVTQTGCVRTVYDTVRVTGIGGGNNTVPSYPNPAMNTVTVRFYMEEDSKTEISIYNSMGVLMKWVVKMLPPGNNTVTIPISELQPGQYFIDIRFLESERMRRKSSIFQKL